VTPTIFIVEDDVDTREMLGRFLELEGYHVESAANGKVALERLDAGAPALSRSVRIDGHEVTVRPSATSASQSIQPA
jgi:CheY-like chemotaxis protein